MAELTRNLRRLLATTGAESDADLLRRFVADRDGPAFAALVSRHGPTVLAVCRRVLCHRQDAEDAFQATFLVLARRAAAVRPPALLGNWLYGVAYRTALSARRQALARRAREAKAAVRAEDAAPEPAGLTPELRAALDREVAALPAAYRAAVVACDLEGLSRHAAVARLGWTEGTLASRLARGRALLARRLSRYALAVPAAGLGAVAAPAVVAAELAETTVRLGILLAAGEAAVAAPVAALMEGAMGTMLLTKFKALAAAVVVGCAVAVTAAAGWRADAAGTDDSAQPVEAPKRGARNPDKERIAELERERALLLKQVAELRDRLAKAEAEQQRTAVKEAVAQRAAAEAAAAVDALARERAAALSDRVQAAEAALDQAAAMRAAAEAKRAQAARDLPTREPGGVPTVPAQPVLPPRDPFRAGPAPAAEPAPVPAKTAVKLYPVADLAGTEKDGETLARVLRATVEPKSWGADAGVEYMPGRKVLVVRQTAQGHKEVAEVLQLLQGQSGRR